MDDLNNNTSVDLKQKKDDLHKKIDDNITNILKHLGNIFEAVKFNEHQYIEDSNNLELATNSEGITHRLNELLKVIYDMKADCLKRSEYNQLQRKEQTETMKGMIKDLNIRFNMLQENYNYINIIIKEMKLSKFYRYSLNYN
jgi:hypothetical protein